MAPSPEWAWPVFPSLPSHLQSRRSFSPDSLLNDTVSRLLAAGVTIHVQDPSISWLAWTLFSPDCLDLAWRLIEIPSGRSSFEMGFILQKPSLTRLQRTTSQPVYALFRTPSNVGSSGLCNILLPSRILRNVICSPFILVSNIRT